MFRQVVMYRWREGVTEDALQGLRDAAERMRAIPELVGLTFGDDGDSSVNRRLSTVEKIISFAVWYAENASS